MKANILQRFTNIFQQQIDVETYKNQLKSYWVEYKIWWFKPLEAFRREYQEKHGSIFNSEYKGLQEKFEQGLRLNNDMLARFYDFMDKSYTVYINATSEERLEIRRFVEKQSDMDYYFEDLIRKYVKDHIVEKIRLTGKRIWLLRGLVAMAIENSGVDYRDTSASLAELYTVAKEKDIKLKTDWDKISNISGDEIPRGGTMSMKKIMTGIQSQLDSVNKN